MLSSISSIQLNLIVSTRQKFEHKAFPFHSLEALSLTFDALTYRIDPINYFSSK